MIQLYGCGSPNVLKVLLMLEEVQQPYQFTKIDVYNGGQFAPEFLAISPNNRVPAIVDDEGPAAQALGQPLALFESNAILMYLAEKTGQLLPTSQAQRAVVMQWLMFQTAGVGPMFGQAVHFQFVAPKGKGEGDYARRRFITEVKRLYDVLEQRLSQTPWLGGEHYTIADVATYPWAGKYRGYPDFDARPNTHPNLARWVDAIEERPAYQRIAAFYHKLYKDSLVEQQTADPDLVDRFFARGRYFRVPAAE